MTMGDQWSYKPNDNYKPTFKLIHLLVDIVGKGGNFLLNVGPQPNGELPAEALTRMKEIGQWLEVNGEAIYGTRPVAPYKQGQVVFTKKGANVYAIYLPGRGGEGLHPKVSWPGLKPKPGSKVYLLGFKKPLPWSIDEKGQTTVEIPGSVQDSPPCEHAFVFKFNPEL